MEKLSRIVTPRILQLATLLKPQGFNKVAGFNLDGVETYYLLDGVIVFFFFLLIN